MTTDLVWYAAYGSNLDSDRFRCYLTGDRPAHGRLRHCGCRDTSPPLSDRPLVLPYRIYFDGHSFTWGGASAYVEHRHDPATKTLARAYLITAKQLADVIDQECDLRAVGRRDVLIDTGSARPGQYGYVLSPGRLDGLPIVTCTCPDPIGYRDGRPSPAYLATMARGLRESHHLDDTALARYLSGIAPDGPTPEFTNWAASPSSAERASRR